jgi:hypothetical protein
MGYGDYRRRMRRNRQNIENVDSHPCWLAGAADFLRRIYIDEGTMTNDLSLKLYNRATGECDIARPLTDEERLQQRLEKAKTSYEQRRIARSEQAKKEARRKREWRKRKNVPDSPVLGEN